MPAVPTAAAVAILVAGLAVFGVAVARTVDAPERARVTAAAPVPERTPAPLAGDSSAPPATPPETPPPSPPATTPAAPAPRYPQVRWRESRAVGLPHRGRLVNGVRLPREGEHFFTWDPVLEQSPNRPWRRWGTDSLVRKVLRIAADYRAAHPRAPRMTVGDLSRPRGGDFGKRFGILGHVSHQNGLDVDVYYPRKDRREVAPRRPGQVDRRLAQALVDRFVAAGAVKVFVGPSLRLRGPRGVVAPLVHHDDHLHARFPVPRR